MEGNFNFKNIKPTLTQPTKMGKKVDTNFKRQINTTGMSIKESLLNEKEDSLKKKIFKLDKMETLVHTDEKLSTIFANFKEDAKELYGYHWNEVILNMIFNDYVMNSPAYLQKYKTTRAKPKTRRGEEGIAQLQNDIDKEKEVSSGAEERKNDLVAKDSETKKTDSEEKLDEWNPFSSKNMSTPTPAIERSKNDTYFIDKRNNIVGVAPYKDQQQFKDVISKFAGNPDIKQISWFDAVSKGIKNVPTEVTDGNYNQIKSDLDTKYKTQGGYEGIPALAETDGAESSGSDTQNSKEIADQTYQNETTTSASSGQYSGKAIWSKDGKPAANKPAWKGGVVLGESVINGDHDYLTDPTAFKKYITRSEVIQFLTEANQSFGDHAAKMIDYMDAYVEKNPHVMSDPIFKGEYDNAKKSAMTSTAQSSSTIPTQKVGDNSSQWKPQMGEATDQDKYEDVIFIQGEEADEPLQILRDQGQDAAMEYLKQWHDSGNHMGRNELPHGTSDQTYEKDGYHMAWNDRLGYIGLTYDLNHESGISEEPSFDGAMKKDLKYNGNKVTDNESTDELEANDGLFKGKWNDNEKSLDEKKGLWDNIHAKKERGEKPLTKGQEGYPDKKQWNKLTKEEISNNKLTENKNTMNKVEYKNIVKAMLESAGQTLSTMDSNEKKVLFENADAAYKKSLNESMIDDQPDSMINNQENSMVKSMESDELNTDGQPVASTGGVQEDTMGDEPMRTKKDDVSGDEYGKRIDALYNKYHTDDNSNAPEVNNFNKILKDKFGVDSIDQLSYGERQELMKSMKGGFDPEFNNKKEVKPEMDFTQFQATDAQKAEYQGRDQEMLNNIAQNADNIHTVQDFLKVAKGIHPMAVLASIQALSNDSPLKMKLKNVENILTSQMKASKTSGINEERKNSSILNVEKLGAENNRNFKTDMSKEDALTQDKTYPYKEKGIYTEKVWPDPSKFYIEQGKGNSQELAKELTDKAKSSADLEKESLARTKTSLENIGNSTADGKNIPKRNLTKDEEFSLAMNRGKGMQDIVYDNEPSEKFEKRMEQDMGDKVYKARQDKMDYQKDAPMYNKDTQPTESGDKKKQDNKFEKGFNSESVTGKYKDEFKKFKLVEFKIGDVEIVDTINENAYKLSLDGMGNKYTLVGKKINENSGFENVANEYDFYLFENKISAIKKVEGSTEPKVFNKGKVNESSFSKMQHLMNYKPTNYVDTKKSVKF